MSTGFTFGAKSPATPGFGQTNFGAQPTGGSITFGTPIAPQNAAVNANFVTPRTVSQTPGFFGVPPAKTSNLSFGTPAPNQGLSFGATPNATLNFGAPVSSAAKSNYSFATPSATSVNFGAPAATSGGGFSFGAPATSAPTSLTFGTPQSTGFAMTPSVAGSGMGFGTAPSIGTTGLVSSAPGLSFGGGSTGFPTGGGFTYAAPTTTTSTAPAFSLNFGTTTTTMTTSAPSLGSGFGVASNPLAPSLNFGASAIPQSTSLGMGLGLGTVTTQPAGLSFGLGGTPAAFNLPALKPTTTVATSAVGLGGITTSKPTSGTAASGKGDVAPRDQALPNEILQTVDSFKSFIKQQKSYSSDVARCPVKEFRKVAEDIDTVANLLNEVEKQLQGNRAVAEKLKYDTTKGLQQIEMAQRTFDTPPGLQYENSAPLNYFIDLVNNFERDLHNLKLQIENTDKYVKNMGKPMPLTSQDLALGMRRLHESFVVLAGRLQSVHNQVETQKEHYMNLRKYMLHDDTNVFEEPQPQPKVVDVVMERISYKPPTIASGPTPFNSLSHPSVVQAAAQNQAPGNASTSQGFGTSQSGSVFSSPPVYSHLFGGYTGPPTSSFGQSSLQFNSANSSFQLQKPPAGNKRGKQ